jgi:hypothetical protein
MPGTDGSAANGDVSITEIGNYESVLRIDDLRPEHNANYTCVAENYAGKAQHSLTLRVKGRNTGKNYFTFAPKLLALTVSTIAKIALCLFVSCTFQIYNK